MSLENASHENGAKEFIGGFDSSALCRSRRELSNEYLLAKIGVDTAENELQVLFKNIQNYSILFVPFFSIFFSNIS